MAIILRDVSLTIDGHNCLQDINLEFDEQTQWAILGPNGGGKTTLLKIIMGLVKPTSGRVIWQDIKTADVAYLSQVATADVGQPLQVFEFIALGMWSEIGAFRGLNGEQTARLDRVIAASGLDSVRYRYLAALSGGQMQRALIARMMVSRARFYILDEPFNAVDAVTKDFLLSFLDTLKEENRGLILVTHDKSLVEARIGQVVILNQTVHFAGSTESVDFARFSKRDINHAV